MSDARPVGPYEMLATSSVPVPLYLIPFDKKGRCTGPLTLGQLLNEVEAGNFTDIHIFSHGWNNIFRDAVALYKEFFSGYLKLRDELRLNDPSRYKPMLVGIIWPSTALVLPWEQPPHIAALAGSPERVATAGEEHDALDEVASAINENTVTRFYELSQRPVLNQQEARELAEILLPIFQTTSDIELDLEGAVTPDDILAVWVNLAAGEHEPRKPGFARDDQGEPAQPGAAGIVDFLDPRRPIQIATVLLMKDRSGTVGAFGVGPQLVSKLLGLGKARVHLIGHSYGAKVMLSALCYEAPTAKARSMLLLQPAISYLCFGENIDGKGRRGGYRDALDRVELPIFSTFSSNDVPLTKFFHLAVRRDSDLGEVKIAGAPPSEFAALGGYGPGGLREGESETIPMRSAPSKYPFGQGGVRVYGVDGSDHKILGHGDVKNVFTEWAELNLVSGGELS
jgi:hypothetical protein